MKIIIELKDKHIKLKKADNLSKEIFILLKEYKLRPKKIYLVSRSCLVSRSSVKI